MAQITIQESKMRVTKSDSKKTERNQLEQFGNNKKKKDMPIRYEDDRLYI